MLGGHRRRRKRAREAPSGGPRLVAPPLRPVRPAQGACADVAGRRAAGSDSRRLRRAAASLARTDAIIASPRQTPREFRSPHGNCSSRSRSRLHLPLPAGRERERERDLPSCLLPAPSSSRQRPAALAPLGAPGPRPPLRRRPLCAPGPRSPAPETPCEPAVAEPRGRGRGGPAPSRQSRGRARGRQPWAAGGAARPTAPAPGALSPGAGAAEPGAARRRDGVGERSGPLGARPQAARGARRPSVRLAGVPSRLGPIFEKALPSAASVPWPPVVPSASQGPSEVAAAPCRVEVTDLPRVRTRAARSPRS